MRNARSNIHSQPYRQCAFGAALGLAACAAALIIADRPDQHRGPTRMADDTPHAARTPSRPATVSGYGMLPLRFEPNHGQVAQPIRYIARGCGYGFFLTPDEAIIALRRGPRRTRDRVFRSSVKPIDGVSSAPAPDRTVSVVRMRWEGANPETVIESHGERPGRSHYLKGKRRDGWHTGIPHHDRVRYKNVYPGIDLDFHGDQQRLEYDFIVSPGQDPSVIAIAFEGLNLSRKPIRVDRQGNLVLNLEEGELIQRAPRTYQEIDGQRVEIESAYELRGDGRVGFQVAAWDRRRPLVIDPVLGYSTYLGGTGEDIGLGVAVDGNGNAYVTGETFSLDFPVATAIQPNLFGNFDAFVTKLNPDGSDVVYSTYLGGQADDFGNAIAVDGNGNAYVTGETRSLDFPATDNAFQMVFGGASVQGDAFVARIGPNGNALAYASYLGGGGGEIGFAIAVDANGNAFVAGVTGSSNFPTVNAFQSVYGTGGDAFVSKVDPSGQVLVYSTFLGGTLNENAYGIAVNQSGQAYVTGFTDSIDFPTESAFQETLDAFRDAFVTQISTSGQELVFSTYLGGSQDDIGNAIAVDLDGEVYVGGETFSDDFYTVSAFKRNLAGPSDGFVTKLRADGSRLVFSTYLGGRNSDAVRGLAVSSTDNAFVGGVTESGNFPLERPFLAAFAGGQTDGFVTKFAASGTALDYSSFLGGGTLDGVLGLALGPEDIPYVVGSTDSTDFLVTNAYQSSLRGQSDAFVAKIVEVPQPVAVIDANVTEGHAPLVVSFMGSGSIVTAGSSIQTYHWDFGDGNTTTTTASNVTHTYTSPGSYVATLFVTTDLGQASTAAPLPIVVADANVTDYDLFVNKAQFSVNWKQHLREEPADSLKLSGYVNPKGLTSFSRTKISLSINDETIFSEQAIRGRSKRATEQKIVLSFKTNGAYSISVQNADLRKALGVRDMSEERDLRMEIDLTFHETMPAYSPVLGVIEVPWRSSAGGTGKGVFNFKKNETFTGVFKSTRTTATELPGGGHKITAKGFMDGELDDPIVPTGDTTIMIGDTGTGTGATIIVPLIAMSQRGFGQTSTFTYSRKLAEVPELRKFQIANGRRKVVMATNELTGTGIPATGSAQSVFDMPLIIDVPTSAGVVRFATIIELKRKNDASKKWKR